MKRAFLLIATALLLTAAQAGAPVLHAAAPAFTLRDQNGTRVSLASARGEKAVLVFYRGYW